MYVMKGTANLFNYFLLCLKFTIVFELIHTTIIFFRKYILYVHL